MNLNQWAERHRVSGIALKELSEILAPNIPKTLQTESSEKSIQKQIRLATNMTGGLLMRNNSGSLLDKRGVPVRFGLGNDSSRLNKKFKSSDLIGITPIRVTPSDIDRTWGVFTAIETKRSGWSYTGGEREEGQLAFINAIKVKGGIASFVTSPIDYLQAIAEFRK